MTSINAGIPKALAEGVREAQTRGQESEPAEPTEPKLGDTPVIDESFASEDTVCRPPVPAPAPVRRRRGVARLRSAAASRRSEGSPTGAAGMRRQLHLQPVAGPSSRPFVTQGSSSSDPFGISIREDPPLRTPQLDPSSDDESTNSADQENDSILSPTKPRQTPRKSTGTPRRPQGAPPVPLGELTLEDDSPYESEAEAEPEPEVEEPSPPSSPSSASIEEEYPPSPRKSPSKSPAKKLPMPSSASNPFFQSQAQGGKPQHRSTAALFGPGARNFTPPNGLARPLASDSPYIAYTEGDDTTMAEPSPSPRKARLGGGGLFQLPAKKSEVPAARTLFGRPAGAGAGASGFGSINGKTATVNAGAIRKSQRSSKSQSPPSSAEKRRMRDKRLWDLCGGDVRRWNRGDFGAEEGFAMKAARW